MAHQLQRKLVVGLAKLHASRSYNQSSSVLSMERIFVLLAFFSITTIVVVSIIQTTYSVTDPHSHAMPNYKGHYVSSKASASLLEVTIGEALPQEPRKEAPENNNPTVKLFIAFTTSYDKKSEKLRNAIRSTWLNYNSKWKDQIAHKFFAGISPQGLTIPKAELEYGDIVFLPFMDTYNNLSIKTMYLCNWAAEHYNFDYLAKMDDDTFLRLDRFVDLLLKKATPTKYYGGKSHPGWKPTRDPSYKWAVSKEEFPEDTGPAWVQGFMYVLSYDSARFIGEKLKDPRYPRLHLEDINTSLIMAEFGAKPSQIDGIMINPRCKENVLAMHYSNSTLMYKFYYASLTGNKNMCRDVTLNFET